MLIERVRRGASGARPVADASKSTEQCVQAAAASVRCHWCVLGRVATVEGAIRTLCAVNYAICKRVSGIDDLTVRAPCRPIVSSGLPVSRRAIPFAPRGEICVRTRVLVVGPGGEVAECSGVVVVDIGRWIELVA